MAVGEHFWAFGDVALSRGMALGFYSCTATPLRDHTSQMKVPFGGDSVAHELLLLYPVHVKWFQAMELHLAMLAMSIRVPAIPLVKLVYAPATG